MPATFTSTVVSNAAVTNSVATSQTPSGAGNLTLTASPVTFTGGTSQFITLISTANIANRTITITGTDIYGNAAVQALTGPNNETITSTIAFASVSQVAISGSAAGAMTVGNSADSDGVMWVLDADSNPFSVSLGGIVVSGSPHFTVKYTYDDVLAKTYNTAATTNVWWSLSALSDKSANTDSALTAPVRAVKLTLSVAGTVKLVGLQTGAGNR